MLSFAAFCRHLASSDPASTPSSPTSLIMPVIPSSSRRSPLRPTSRPSSPPSTTIDASTRNSPRQPPSCTRVTLRYRHPSLFPFPCNVPPATPLPASCNSRMRHAVHPIPAGPPPTCHGPHQVTTGPLRHRAANASTATPPSPFYLPPPSSPLPYLSCLSPPNLLSPYLPPPISPPSPSMPARRRRTCRRPTYRHRL